MRKSNHFKKTILVIDDEPNNLKAILDCLKESNYKVLIATDGQKGYDIAISTLPDLIIMDWEMPVMNGIDTIKLLKQNESVKDIPVIMATGKMLHVNNLKEAIDAGAIDYIRKPFDKVELLARIQAALKLAESYSDIKNLNLSKDKLLSIIAHDLKNPFSSLIGFSKLLINDFDSYEKDKILKYLDHIYQASQDGYQLLENLLQWSCLQLNKTEFSPGEIDLHETTDKAISVLKLTIQEKKIKIHNAVSFPLICYADENMIGTVIRNLLSNAIKYSHEGAKIDLFTKEKDGFIEYCIKDEGIGMDDETKMRLFTFTDQVIKHGTMNEKGTGLGLILCKEFVEKHDGKIWVESSSEKGSTFVFNLPVK